MDFEKLVDIIIGSREYFHVIECHYCGYDEIYFQDPITKELLGVSCMGCNYVKRFDFNAKIYSIKNCNKLVFFRK